MTLKVNRDNECDWKNVDKTNRKSLGGGGHTVEECTEKCKESYACKFAALSRTGYCHFFETCNGNGGKGFSLYEKKCGNRLSINHELINKQSKPLIKMTVVKSHLLAIKLDERPCIVLSCVFSKNVSQQSFTVHHKLFDLNQFTVFFFLSNENYVSITTQLLGSNYELCKFLEAEL